jgi:hypothetical protein
VLRSSRPTRWKAGSCTSGALGLLEERFGEEEKTYEGPWQFFGRDIDPTLPPARRERDEEDNLVVGPTFPRDEPNAWWAPAGPHYGPRDPPPDEGWVEDVSDVPAFESLVRRTDPSGTCWVVLQAYHEWQDEPREHEEWYSRQRRDMWSHIYSWLVSPSDRAALVSYLEEHSLMGRWMPEGRELTDDSYLGEVPWAASAQEFPDGWREIWPRYDAAAISIRVYPTWLQYYWEGNVLDCSISEGVRAMLPAPLLFQAGELEWKPLTREWYSGDGTLIAQNREAARDRHSALLVREDWLKAAITKHSWLIVVAWLGEKRLFAGGRSGGLEGGWTELNGIASLAQSAWKFCMPRFEYQPPTD